MPVRFQVDVFLQAHRFSIYEVAFHLSDGQRCLSGYLVDYAINLCSEICVFEYVLN